jgi:hypothetical protein
VQVDEILSTQSLHTPTPIKPAAHSQPFDKEVTRLVQVA